MLHLNILIYSNVHTLLMTWMLSYEVWQPAGNKQLLDVIMCTVSAVHQSTTAIHGTQWHFSS
jgi:hypothetical protein